MARHGDLEYAIPDIENDSAAEREFLLFGFALQISMQKCLAVQNGYLSLQSAKSMLPHVAT